MSIFTSRPALRWGVPVAVGLTVIGGTAVASTIAASAAPTLPPRSAAQLLVDLQTARLDAASGTVVERADLGIPALPGLAAQGSSNLTSLISGAHTLRVWYSGPDKARVALLGTLGENDVIVNGRDMWTWDSQKNEATHRVIEARDPAGKHPGLDAKDLPKTPQEAADRALKAIDPSTKVTTTGSARVAGRAAYELTLFPRDTSSLVGRVTLAIDAEQHIPLRVQVYPAGSDKTAIEVAFTQISFAKPDPAQFTFTPPKGTTVTEEKADASEPRKDASEPRKETGAQPEATGPEPVVVGQGWTSVIAGRVGTDASAESPQAGQLLESLPRVSGQWGSGRLLTGRLFSVLLTDDGRVLAGAVRPDRLYQVAADPAAALKATK
jgi:outer membrane lipoprotein-sorting protein